MAEEEFTSPDWLVSILDWFESQTFFDETDVSQQIMITLSDLESQSDLRTKSINAELWGFQFWPKSTGELSLWRTYFGPIWISGDKKTPDIEWLDVSIIDYWSRRMTQAKHPLLRARYADLVWDLSKVSCEMKPPIKAAHIAIDGYNACSELADENSAMTASSRLQRGLQLALSIHDQNRANQTRDCLFKLFSRIDEMWGWTVLFDTFEEQAKIAPTNLQRDTISNAFEKYLSMVEQGTLDEDPARIFHVAARLVRHYQRLEQQGEADRIVKKSGQVIEKIATTEDGLKANYLLDHVYRFYRINNLETEAERVQILARQFGESAQSNLKGIPIDLEMSSDELEDFADGITAGGLEMALRCITWHFICDLDQIRTRLQEMRKQFPLVTMFPVVKMSQGQAVSTIGPIETDPNGSLINGISDDITFRMLYLAAAFDKTWERYTVTPDEIVSLLFESPVFSVKFRGIIKIGIEAYFVGDHLKAIHVLVPQIENALRVLLQLLGRPPNKPRRGNSKSMTEKTLTDILEYEPIIKETLGEAVHLYFITLLSDPRGKNIRNRMSHGLMAGEEFHRGISDRVLHIFLILGFLREVRKDEIPTRSSS